MQEEVVIKTENSLKRFGLFTATNEVTFEVQRRNIPGFSELTGAGKLTPCACFAVCSIPSAGNATVAGFDVYKDRMTDQKNIGYMSQKFFFNTKIWAIKKTWLFEVFTEW